MKINPAKLREKALQMRRRTSAEAWADHNQPYYINGVLVEPAKESRLANGQGRTVFSFRKIR
ncbi:hypothetical protein OPIT5_18045 [Opitutaceae bacterium TAV5]|nr:hypothetical protein OPIT5_18045 [Opitutaceae bacterium TAV5]